MSKHTRQIVGSFPTLPDDWLPGGPVVYLDIETTGFSPYQAQVTLVGLAWEEQGVRRLEQHFVDEPEGEADVLRAAANRLCQFAGVITYNGHSFDLRFLRVRASSVGVRWPRLEHLDLLYVVREWQRTYGLLSDCRLQTVMAHFRLGRTDHTGGDEMVRAYRQWLRTGDPVHRDLILGHNAEDLLLLPDLVPYLTQSPHRDYRVGL